MPTYEYSCGACGTVSEINHRMSDPSPTDCPACGKPQLSKLMSAAGFRLKGGGWYETDFKSDGKRNLAGDNAATGAESGKADAKPDAKPAGGGDAAKAAPVKSESKSESKPAAAPTAKPASPGGGSTSSP